MGADEILKLWCTARCFPVLQGKREKKKARTKHKRAKTHKNTSYDQEHEYVTAFHAQNTRRFSPDSVGGGHDRSMGEVRAKKRNTSGSRRDACADTFLEGRWNNPRMVSN